MVQHKMNDAPSFIETCQKALRAVAPSDYDEMQTVLIIRLGQAVAHVAQDNPATALDAIELALITIKSRLENLKNVALQIKTS